MKDFNNEMISSKLCPKYIHRFHRKEAPPVNTLKTATLEWKLGMPGGGGVIDGNSLFLDTIVHTCRKEGTTLQLSGDRYCLSQSTALQRM